MTSLYVDVDGRRYPRPSDVEGHLGHLFRLARAEAAALGDEARAAMEADLAAIGDWLANGLDRHATRGIAAFSSARTGLLTTFALPVTVPDRVGLDRHPQVGPLLAALQTTRPCVVVLADRQRSRLIRLLQGGHVDERPGPFDPLERRVDTDVELGSFERLHEEALRRHLRAVAGAVGDELRELPDAYLLVGGPAAAELAAELDPVAAARVGGDLKVAITTSTDEVARLATGLRAALEDRREADLVDTLVNRSGSGTTLGVEATLDALASRRVHTLVVDRDLHRGGVRCATCGGLAEEGTACPRCGGHLDAVPDLLEAAVADALAAGATVELVGVAELTDQGGMGAIERY